MQIQDLLRPESENLQIRESEGGGVYVAGVCEREVASIEQCLALLQQGDRNRTTAFTALNAHSSRSHGVMMLSVAKRKRVGGDSAAAIERVQLGRLFMVDLAGSERLKKSKSTGVPLRESGKLGAAEDLAAFKVQMVVGGSQQQLGQAQNAAAHSSLPPSA